MSSKEDTTRPKFSFLADLGDFLIKLGFFLFALALLVLANIYLPIAKTEIVYEITKNTPPKEIEPVNRDFGLVIKKIGANAAVIANVDPYDPAEYQEALSRGIAHAKGTALPGEKGNIFIFSHSSADFLTATRYNSIFYLLDKLSPGDQVDLYYQGRRYTYELKQKRIVGPEEVDYLQRGDQEQLTLMTCWPPGTTLKRLIWQAVRVLVQ